MKKIGVVLVCILSLCLLATSNSWAQEEQQDTQLTTTEEVQVTATRIPEPVDSQPASITIVTGKELIDTGSNDLASALALVGGVSIAPGGDNGPASSVPEIWGLREFDAFLLVVDGVPWGGAFNPELATLDLNNIERIEILRGAAPVMYGATSFVGVIHVIHRAADSKGNDAHAYGGNYSTGGGSVRVSLPGESWKHSLSANFDSQGYKDDRTDYNKGHILYRGMSGDAENGLFHVDADLTFLKQDPASPHPRAGAVLDPSVPLDANHNPSDAQNDANRFHFVGGYDSSLMGSKWSILAALSHTEKDVTRGFLSEVDNAADPNAAGFRQNIDQTDLYIDTHFAYEMTNAKWIFGADEMFGKGEMESDNVDYHVFLDGSSPQSTHDVPVQERPRLEDERNFFGLYTQFDWTPTSRVLVQAGLRFNSTHETREGEVEPGDAGGEEPGEEEGGKDDQSNNRMSGTIGASFLAFTNTDSNVWVYADYRNSFKPAAIDFGPEAEGGILEPETANSYEGGAKGNMMHGQFHWDFSVFRMDFENLVTATVSDDGLPILINSGTEKFTGFEAETQFRLEHNINILASYAHHSAKFKDFVQAFDGVPTQLGGRKLEMSPDDLFSAGVIYAPPEGINGSFILNYVGERFLNKRNTAPTDAYTTLALGVGYRFGRHNVRFDIENMTDERDPVAESELGDAQYYRMPARNFRIGWQVAF